MSKIALITGASSGIGKNISIKMAQLGYKIVLVARSKQKLDKISNEINKNGGSSLPVAMDLSVPENIMFLKESVVEYGGEVSVILNNAGLGIFNKIENVTLEEWNLHLDTNLRASFLVTKAFISEMKELNRGSIVFINSVAGKKGYSNSTAYVASKYGMRGFADSLREELRENNIKVLSVYPGAVNTPFWDKLNLGFPTDDMLDLDELSKTIIEIVEKPGNFTVEEIVIRRVGGDF